jgi:hypothetical protein
MLHIITPLYRFENLEKIYNSILMNDDIRWHISYSKTRTLPELEFLKEDKRIVIYEVDCLDSEAFAKRNAVLSKINDGYFCFLDDDTLFHENMYAKFVECSENNFSGMLVGRQLAPDNTLRLIESIPLFQKIDVGNVLCHYNVLEQIKYPTKHIEGYNNKDFIFWKSVYEYLGRKCNLTSDVISYYNKISGINLLVIRNKNNKIVKKINMSFNNKQFQK